MSELRDLIAKELPELVEIRHDLHRHPELGYEEHRTSEVVQRELGACGVEVKGGLARGTGVLGHLGSTNDAANAPSSDRRSIALRADMDALPILEQTAKPYCSTNGGVMHACGHDGHTTILIGAARVLSKLASRPNPVTFVFQPAEEGGAGGQAMCDDGVLLGEGGGGIGPPVGRIFGLHGWPTMTFGHIGTRPGALLASTDDFVVTIHGSEGHAAFPHLCHDPILAAGHVLTAIQAIASRSTSPTEAVVCTVGAINGGTANNVIPASVRMIGTIRALNDQTRARAKERFFELVERTSEAHGCRGEIDWHEGYPVTRNDPALAEHVLGIARDAIGDARVEMIPDAVMGGEDFSFYGLHVPACFYLLGTRPEGAGEVAQLHQATFDFNDDAIALGVEMMCRLALSDD